MAKQRQARPGRQKSPNQKRGWVMHQVVGMSVVNARGVAPSVLLADMLAAAGKHADATAYLSGALRLTAVIFGPDPQNAVADRYDVSSDTVTDGAWAEAGIPGVIVAVRDVQMDMPDVDPVTQLVRYPVKRVGVLLCKVRLPRAIDFVEALHADVSWEPQFDPSVLPVGTAFTYVSGKWRR